MKYYVLILLLMSYLACNRTNNTKAACMEAIMEQDSVLGEIRNHASEQINLSEIIANYVTGINQLDFQKCPKAFEKAFQEHAQAWSGMTSVIDNYKDLRGELHELFDKLEKSKDAAVFKEHLDIIWSTWRAIEAV